MLRFFLLVPLLAACSHTSRIERLEREVRSLKAEIGELEADWTLFQSTPDGRWIYPKKADEDESGRKKERRAKK